jgi:hypothetical protein
MKERTSVLIIVLCLLGIGVAITFASLFLGEFNFYKSELAISNDKVTEVLYFKTDKQYHTLFRNFYSSAEKYDISSIMAQGVREAIAVQDISCTAGTPYLRTVFGRCYQPYGSSLVESQCQGYTENNEIGCTFGNVYGFNKGEEHKLRSTFYVQAPTLFKIRDTYYIKFHAYSKDKHHLLIRGSSLIIHNEDVLSKKVYLPSQEVILYTPYSGDISSSRVVLLAKPEYDSSYLSILFYLLIAFAPAIFFFLVWVFCGRERTEIDLPDSLSYWPDTKRKGWEVASYFHPPFGVMDNEFFAATILDLHRRKIVSLKSKDGESWIKLPSNTELKDADGIEKEVISVLRELKEYLSDDYKDAQGYCNLKKLVAKSHKKRIKILEIQKLIKTASKVYLDYKGQYFSYILLPLLYFAFAAIQMGFYNSMVWFVILFYFFIQYTVNKTAILVKFKGDFYREYQHWQAFRKYLKAFPSMKESPHEAVVLWEQYLVYATALGVSKQVLKKLRDLGVINEDNYHMFYGVHVSSSSFSTAAGTSGGGVGGGVGGGGAGGGGGGGR